MSDYISIVLSQAFGLSGGIRPKVPSLFEPVENHPQIASQMTADDGTAQGSSTGDDHFPSLGDQHSPVNRHHPQSESRLDTSISSENVSAGMMDDGRARLDPHFGEMQAGQSDNRENGLDQFETRSPERLSVTSEDRIDESRPFYEKESMWADAPGDDSVAAKNLMAPMVQRSSQNSRDSTPNGEMTPKNNLKIPDSTGNADLQFRAPLDKHSDDAIDHQFLHQLSSELTEYKKADSPIDPYAEFRDSKTPKNDFKIPDTTGNTDVQIQSSLDKRSEEAIDHKFLHQSSYELTEFPEADSSISPNAELFLSKGGKCIESSISLNPSLEMPKSIIDQSVLIMLSSGRMQPINWQMKSSSPISEGSSLTKETSQGPPTIKVTIGRIEVKAAAITEKKAIPSATKARSISLDDYLLSLKR